MTSPSRAASSAVYKDCKYVLEEDSTKQEIRSMPIKRYESKAVTVSRNNNFEFSKGNSRILPSSFGTLRYHATVGLVVVRLVAL